MANSDIIKIGFDYRASLEQFEKETNGVFEGISDKAGKQKITIQLDAKDDKVIDKIKELQKLKLDKFTFEFGNSGLKEQLQTFDKLENKINDIISLSKGIDLSFNTKNKTEAYNQLKKYADAFKDYYGNEEAMATNAGAKVGYAYYKAYEEALRKGVAQSKLEKVTIDFDVNDSIFSKERIVENRIKEFENFQKYGNADESNLIAEITLLENRLLKFNSAYSQVKANLGDAPITPEITKNIEEYVRLLEIAESRAKDAELFGYSSEDINSDKDLANMYLDFAKEDATTENKKYIESLKQQETQAITTAEADQKLAEVQKETVSNTSNSNDSQIEELKSNIQEVKTELGDVKDRISSIESNGFENVREDVENTKESVKELNSELAEIKSNLSSTQQESNISSGNSSVASAEKFQQITGDTVNVLSDVGKTEDQIVQKIQKERAEAEANNEVLREHLVLLDKAGKVVANHWGSTSNVNGTYTDEQLSQAQGGKIIHAHPGKASFFGGQDLKHLLQDSMYDQIKQIDLIWGDSTLSVDKSSLTKESSSTILNIMRNVRKTLTEAYSDNQDGAPSQEVREHINAIEKEIFKTIAQKLNISVSEEGNMAKEVTDALSDVDKSIIKRFSEIKASVIQDTDASSIIKNTMKDAFPKTSENLEQVAQSEQKVQQEAVATDKALDNISFTPNTEGFEDIIAKFGILREQAEKITKIVKTTKQTADGADISYKATLKNGSSYYLGENSTPQVLNANETIYDAKADNAKKLEREKQIWNELTTSLERYATIQKRIASNNALSTDNEEAIKLLEHIHELQRNDILPTEKLTVSNEKLQQINQTVTDLKAKLKESTLDSLQGSIDKYQKIYDQRKTYSSDFTPSEQYTKNLTELNTAIKNLVEYRNTLKNVSEVTTEQETHLKGLVTACEKASDSFKSLSASEKGASQIAVDKLVQRINKDLDECTNYSKEAKLGLRALRDELESANPRNLKEITSEIINIENAEIRAGRAGRSFFDTLKNSGFHQLAAQMAGMFGFYDVINLGKEAISTIVSLDDALVDLKKTTAMNSTQLEDFYYDANDVAKQMGVTTEEIITQASAWSRLGYSSQEAATTMAKLSSKFASISPGMSTDEAQEGLVSIMKAFDIDPDDVETEIMDKVNVLGNKFAEENQDVIEGLKRSAAAMSAMGQSFTDTAALFTGGMEILQDSESMGTALRTLSMRVRGYDEETNQLSDDLVNVTGEVADLTKTAQDSQGVSLFTDATQEHYRSMVEYLGDIADRWDQISEKNQTELLQKLFGKNRANAGAAIIQNFDQVRAAIEAMDESAGSSEAEMSAIESSLSYKINALKETWVGCVQDMIDRGDLGTIVTGLTKVSEAITFLLDKLGILGTIGLGAGIFSGIKNVGRDKMYSLSF